jgi:hypothetical protein
MLTELLSFRARTIYQRFSKRYEQNALIRLFFSSILIGTAIHNTIKSNQAEK